MNYEPSQSSTDAKPPTPQPAKLEVLMNTDLLERRRTIRPIPCPEAIELNDEESWSAWNELMDNSADHSVIASAKATLLALFRRKLNAND
jgi:hypothetical protein